jgi:hypothetical protein
MMPTNLIKWLNGSYTCKYCGRQFYVFSFGFGSAICPDCYKGESPFIFLNKEYWLNRLMLKYLARMKKSLYMEYEKIESMPRDFLVANSRNIVN